ncbi:metal ABC transporter solute-binding protein, Zn/Mn family [Pseudonocardia asaccharolytica]|uniref:metal ABC transporter solute-binding protein, Zn/Mn family n=1 Tax=Pseudonocardia asaccharolytica TaxID=54010 RepID=UPI003CCBC160
MAADPGHAADYRRNLDAYLAELTSLDAGIRERMAAVPAPRRVLVTSHDAFAYFGRRYAVDRIADALGAPAAPRSTHPAPVSASKTATGDRLRRCAATAAGSSRRAGHRQTHRRRRTDGQRRRAVRLGHPGGPNRVRLAWEPASRPEAGDRQSPASLLHTAHSIHSRACECSID